MKRIIGLLFILFTLTLGQFASAVGYTYSTNAKQEADLTAQVAQINAERALQNPPPTPLTITNQQYLNFLLDTAIASYGSQNDERTAAPIRDAYKSATPAQKAAARSALGLP